MKKRIPFSLILIYAAGAAIVLLNLKNYIM